MDEPGHDATRAELDDSLGSEVGERVEKLVDGAERDAQAIQSNADDEAGALLEAARAEARAILDAAERRAQELAAERVTRILALHRDLSEEAQRLAGLAEDPEGVLARVNALLDALARRADLLVREIAPAPAPAAEEGEPAEPAIPADRRPPTADAERAIPADRRPPTADAEPREPTAEELEAAMAVPVGTTPEPLREAHLTALRSAVAGASRADLEAELSSTLAPEDAAAVLDDVFGRPKSPFPKWSAAVKKVG